MVSNFCFGNENLVGVTLREKPINSEGTLVDVGLDKVFFSSYHFQISQSGLFYKLYAWIDFCLMLQSVVVDQVLSPGVRVTVAMGADRDLGTVNLFIISQLSYSFVFFALRKTCIYSFKLMNIGFGSSRFSTSDCSAL